MPFSHFHCPNITSILTRGTLSWGKMNIEQSRVHFIGAGSPYSCSPFGKFIAHSCTGGGPTLPIQWQPQPLDDPFNQMIPRVTWWEATGLQTVMVQLWLSAVTLRQFGKVCDLIYKRRLLISTDALMNANNHNAFFWKHWYQNVLFAAGCVLTTAPKMTL